MPPQLVARPDGGPTFCAPSGAFCVTWAINVAAGTATYLITARTRGYVAIGFADQYNVMSPAAVYAAWVDPNINAGMLSHRHNDNGYNAPSVETLGPASEISFAAVVGGTLTAQFTAELPDSVLGAIAALKKKGSSVLSSGSLSTSSAPPPPTARRHLHAALTGVDVESLAPVNLIWCVGSGVPANRAGRLVSHGSTEGSDFGAASVDMLCGDGTMRNCVLAVGTKTKLFTRLHAIALAGFLSTLAFGVLCTLLRRRIFALEHVAQLTFSRLPGVLARRADAWGMSYWGLPETCLLTGYFVTFAFYLQAALVKYPASPARAVGSLLAPMFAVALLPVTRQSLWVPLLGVSFERAIAFHRAAAVAALVVMYAHGAMMVHERGRETLSSRVANVRGLGSIYGSAACATFTFLGLLSTPSVRSTSWEMFKAAHITFMPTAIVLSIVHAYYMLPFLLPPLLLWAFDVLLRSVRSARSYNVLGITPLHGAAVRLEVATHGRLHVKPGQYAYVQVPAISPGEWHPLSIVAAPGDPTSVSFIISRGSPESFGARVASLSLANIASIRVRLDGSYGGPGLQLHRYASVLLVAGGVGITPFASMMEHLVECAAVEGSLLRSAALLWSVRTREAEDKWIPGLMPSLQSSGLFTTTLCVTRAAQPEPADEADGVLYGRPDVLGAVRTAVDAAAAIGAPRRRVAVLACGPQGLVDAAQAAAAHFGVHFHAEKFTL